MIINNSIIVYKADVNKLADCIQIATKVRNNCLYLIGPHDLTRCCPELLVKMADRRKLYFDLHSAFKLVYPDKSAQSLQSETNKVKAKDNVVDLVQKKLVELGNVKRKTSANLLTYWSQVCNTRKVGLLLTGG